MAKKKTTIECKNVDAEIYNQYMRLKAELGLSHGKMFEMLYNKAFRQYKTPLSARQKIENEVLKQLEGSKPLTTYSIRKETESRLDAVKAVMQLYKDEISNHNKQFEK